jgi:DNA-binding MarR family transcriptional regulator
LVKTAKKDFRNIGIGKRLRLAHMAFARGMRVELADAGVTFGQFVHLERLWSEDGLTQVELSRRVGVEMASSTSILVELETLGPIRRARGEADRRKIFVHLTAKGREVAGPILENVKAVNKAARRDISDDDLNAAFAVLDAITANLNAKYPSALAARADRD